MNYYWLRVEHAPAGLIGVSIVHAHASLVDREYRFPVFPAVESEIAGVQTCLECGATTLLESVDDEIHDFNELLLSNIGTKEARKLVRSTFRAKAEHHHLGDYSTG